MKTDPSMNQSNRRLIAGYAEWVIRYRWVTIALSVLTVSIMASGLPGLGFGTNYRGFFGKENPELNAFLEFQDIYTKTDNIMFVLQPLGSDAELFSPKMAEAIEKTTELAWTLPYSIRVDSISNFQDSMADGDDLLIEDLIYQGAQADQIVLDAKKQRAMDEPLLYGNLLARDARTTGINVTFQFPEKDMMEVPSAAAKAREIRDQLKAEYGDSIHIALTGLTMMNASFAEESMSDMGSLVPLMYLVLLIVMALIIRSFWGTLVTLVVIMFATISAMGVAGMFKVQLLPISALAPTIILTLAIADSIHILVIVRQMMAKGMGKIDAIKESIRVNFIPVSITSLTTIVGFLALNFSDSPPFNHLGSITAVGIFMAWFLSTGLLPAVMSLLPMKVRVKSIGGMQSRLQKYADGVIRHRKPILIGGGLISLVLASLAPLNELNDEWVKYFDYRVPFRGDAEFAMEHLTGVYNLEFSVPAEEPAGISEPEYLKELEAFADWLRAQPEIVHVFSYTDIIKRLNKNMHGDDESYYEIPESKELAAQYQLLYEISLPRGLDLNDRVSIDKSSTRLTATMPELSTVVVRDFISRSTNWLAENAPIYMHTSSTGPTAMFSYIAKRNINSMLTGNILAVVVIAFVMVLALKNIRLGLLSLIPNTIPILVTFGIWALLVGQVGMAAASVAATALGIVVDDTVHFMAKFVHARREKGMSKADAIRYAFDTVGVALMTTTIILSAGFLILTYSTFLINSQMGQLTAIAIIAAFVFDFTILPALLLAGGDDIEAN